MTSDSVPMKVDGLDEAIVGLGQQFDKPPRIIYDYAKCVEIFMSMNDWSSEEAIEWMDFNVMGAYVGEGTPIFRFEFDESEFGEVP